MNNLILLFLSALAQVGVFTKEEAKVLAAEMHISTLPDDFEGSFRLVEKIFEHNEIIKAVAHKEDLDKLKASLTPITKKK